MRRFLRWLRRDGGFFGPAVYRDPDGGPGKAQWF